MATSARTKTKNKPSLKSQGAGYSTTNSKGVTTYYKSAKDAPGYYDTANGKNVKTSPGKPLSRVNAAGTAIPVSDLTPAAPVPMPSKLVPADPGNVVGANNAGLATASNGMLTYDSTSNQLVPNTNEAATAPTATDNFSSLFNQYMGMQEAPPNTADIYAKEARAGQLKQKQESVNNYTAQLNSIVAKSQADQLRLEGQGRGITDVIIGGQQAQINREAAIAALPVQAQLAAAQGDLEMAQQHVDKMFQIKSQDALAQYQYKSKVVDAVYNFATTQEQRRLDALKVQEDRKYAEQQDFLKTQRTLLSSAVQQGAPASVIEAINSGKSILDVISAAGQYNGDVLARQIQQAQLRKLNTPDAPTGFKAPEVKSINGQDMQWNSQTGKWETIAGGTPTNQAIVDATKDTISTISDLKTHKGLKGTVGVYGVGRWTPLSVDKAEQRDFIAGVSQLISQETLGSLINLKAKGGTLGALSEKELAILRSTASKISDWEIKDGDRVVGYEASEADFKRELDRIEMLAKRAQTKALGYDPTYIPTADGSIIDMYVGGGAAFNPASYY